MKNLSLNDPIIEVERLKFLYSSMLMGNLSQIFTAAILVYLLRHGVADSVTFTWLSFMILSSIYAVVISQKFKIKLKKGIKKVSIWQRSFLISISLNAIIWGAAGVFLFVDGSIIHQAYLMLILAAVVAASNAINSASFVAIQIIIPIVIIPFSIRMYLSDSPNNLEFSVLAILYLMVSMFSVLKSNKRINEVLKLKLESRKNDEKQRASEEKFRLIYEVSEDPMVVFIGVRFLMANHAAIQFFGYDNEQHLLSVSARKTVPEYQPDGMKSTDKAEILTETLKKEGYVRLEWCFKHRNKNTIPADITLNAVKYNDKKAVFCIIRDISKVKKFENNLVQAQRKSEEASKAKSDFLANISHEVRTPMNGVIGATELLLRNPLLDEQKLRALTIKRSALSMLKILNEILDFSKIEAGMLELEYHEFNLAHLIDELNSSIINRIKDKRLEFNFSTDSSMDNWYYGDPGRILQVFNNLMDNAIKFTTQGSISFVCQQLKLEGSIATLKFQISDTGIGIDPENADNVFERFKQSDSSTTRKYGGTGLGLSICKQLTLLMGGDIGFNSQKDQGSVFWFTIELSKIEKPTASPTKETNKATQFNARALIVDDNYTNLQVAKDMLGLFGVEADLAENGEQAITRLKQTRYDFILMDCHMPIMNGYMATKKIRLAETAVLNPNITIIAMTASAMQGDKDLCLASGMEDYLTKPVDLIVLESKLLKWLPDKIIGGPLSQLENPHANIPLFNMDLLMQRLIGNMPLIESIISTFIVDLPDIVTKLEDAILEKNLKKVFLKAHRINGSAANVSCLRLSRFARDIEQAAQKENLTFIKQCFANLRVCSMQTIQALTNRDV